MSITDKYDAFAAEFTSREYGDPETYFRHRAAIVLRLGPKVGAGETVVDLACADGSFALPLIEAGLDYTGVDLSEAMAEVARARIAGRGRVELGDLTAWAPPQPVAMTTCFRSLHFVPDREAWFRHLASFTEKKVVFDVSPRRIPLATLRREAAAAGLTRFDVHAFLLPQNARRPAPAVAALRLLEATGPVARALLNVRFVAICAASRG